MSKLPSRLFFKISNISKKIGNNLLPKKEKAWNALLLEWRALDPEKQFRTAYDELGPSSVVFDLGGYKGQWASDIFAKHLCNIHVFEPHPKFVNNIKQRFNINKQIWVYDFGLSSKDQQVTFAADAESTSMFKTGKERVEVQLKCAKTFITEGGFEQIDLMKINIEGGEYELLEHLIEAQLINKIKNIQVQFHHFIPQAESRMNNIHKALEKTHNLTYQFKFLWENWQLK